MNNDFLCTGDEGRERNQIRGLELEWVKKWWLENVREVGWDDLTDVLKLCDSLHSSVCLYTCHRQYFDSGCFWGVLFNIRQLCSLSDTRVRRVDGGKERVSIHSPFCREPCRKQLGALCIVVTRKSVMFRCQGGERNVITYAFLWRGHPVLGLHDCWAEKSYICIRSDVKPMQNEGKSLQSTLITVVSAAYMEFATTLKGASLLVTKS